MLAAQRRSNLGNGEHAVLHMYFSAMSGPGFEFCLEKTGTVTFEQNGVCYKGKIEDVEASIIVCSSILPCFFLNVVFFRRNS